MLLRAVLTVVGLLCICKRSRNILHLRIPLLHPPLQLAGRLLPLQQPPALLQWWRPIIQAVRQAALLLLLLLLLLALLLLLLLFPLLLFPLLLFPLLLFPLLLFPLLLFPLLLFPLLLSL
jgi:hypothetical protein